MRILFTEWKDTAREHRKFPARQYFKMWQDATKHMKTARFEARLHIATKLSSIQRAIKKWQHVLQRKSHTDDCECYDSDRLTFPSKSGRICYFCYNPPDSDSDIPAKPTPAPAKKSNKITPKQSKEALRAQQERAQKREKRAAAQRALRYIPRLAMHSAVLLSRMHCRKADKHPT
jgi:hypothetical protein